ncbi:MAG: peptidoglycan DD-metalloendopeptidase family protein, partial [Actinobacteria bacterium]|nr:peptidoglycan DD-metalloendopeptidase family protein [Actinomycetota bacterium]
MIGLTAPAVPAAAQKPEFTRPVDAEETRGFQKPSHKYGSGHRGIDYEVPSGTAVRASGNGTVKFAGSVGGQGRFVTLQHAGDIETTYSYLSAIEVSEGEQVTQGQVIGQSGAGHPEGPPALHFGAKKSGEYIDPLMLLGQYKDITDLLELLELEQSASASTPNGGAQLAAAHFPEAPLGTVTPPPTLGVDGELKRKGDLQERIEKALAREPESLAEQKQREEAKKQARADRQAAETADWWESLSPAEQERLIKEKPQDLGDRVGVPIEARDRANREALAKRIEFLEERQERMEKAWEEAGFYGRLGQAVVESPNVLPDVPILGGVFPGALG